MIERAHIHAERHPEIDPLEILLVAAGFEAARLRAEVGFAELEAYLVRRPDAATVPYVIEQYAAVAELDGRPRQGLARIDEALAAAATSSVSVRMSVLAMRSTRPGPTRSLKRRWVRIFCNGEQSRDSEGFDRLGRAANTT